MNLAEQAAEIFRQCSHYNMITGEGHKVTYHRDWPLPSSPYIQFQGPRAFLIMRKLDEHGRVIRQRVGYPDGSSLLYEWDNITGLRITTNDRKPDDD